MKMYMVRLAGALCVVPGMLHAQFDFPIAGRDVQVHSFAQQGFAYSSSNNFLTMDTNSGSLSTHPEARRISRRATRLASTPSGRYPRAAFRLRGGLSR